MRVERRLPCDGVFILRDGGHLPSGPVRIEQLASGCTLLYCEQTIPVTLSARFTRITAFQGQTTQGRPVQSHGDVHASFSTADELCFSLDSVEIGQASQSTHAHELSLTNLRFDADDPHPLTLFVSRGNTTIRVRLTPHRNYQARVRDLGVTRKIVPTATLRFNAPTLTGTALSEFITDICTALSLVQGRRINWIYHASYGSQRHFQHAVFGQTITKPYTAQPLCFTPTTRTAVQLPVAAAKEALPAITAFREMFDPHNRIVNAWLDARTETDYLEARTLKYAVVIEALNAITTQTDRSIPKTKVESKTWKKLHQKVIAGLPSNETLVREVLTLESWQRLNLTTFRDTLAAVCKRHHITVSPSDLKLFTRIRNDIVHRFSYDLTIPLPAPWGMPGHAQAAVHFFAAAFVDRIILQLFGLGAHLQKESVASQNTTNG